MGGSRGRALLKNFVCLAKSIREGGFCIAGKEILADGSVSGWFRPIARTGKECLSPGDCAFQIGHVVSCNVSHHAPTPPQHENHIIAEQPGWTILHYFPKTGYDNLVDSPPYLWGTNQAWNTSNGINDRIPETIAASLKNSLYFIKISDGMIIKNNDGSEEEPKIRTRLKFSYNGTTYKLRVTAPSLSDKYWDLLKIGEQIVLGECYITLSLAKPWKNYCYKLVVGYVTV